MNHDHSLLAVEIANILLTHRGDVKHFGCKEQLCPTCRRVIVDKISQFISKKIPISMVLPAFPAKSANSRKTLNHYPDYGEEKALLNLEAIANCINEKYAYGTKIIICSDGRVFNDLVGVTDHHVSEYRDELSVLIKSLNLQNLQLYNLEDYFENNSYAEMRQLLEIKYSAPIEVIKHDVKTNERERHLFNGLHRFVFEDQYALFDGIKSRNKIKNHSKEIAYKVMQRSHAWSNLVESVFIDSIRLSIHPHQCGSTKFAIKLIASSNSWATPWHNVVVEDEHGFITLMKKEKAESLPSQIIYKRKRPSYYKLLAEPRVELSRLQACG